MAERITFTTDDGVIIVGDWFPAPTVLGAVVLFHMMPETRTSWGLLQRELAKRSIASLAIDLRGHGESVDTTEGAKLDYKEFTDEDHQASMFEAVGAVRWVAGRGQDLERIAVGGASIGANLALDMLGEEPKLCGAALFSPGNDYHGLNALQSGIGSTISTAIIFLSEIFEEELESLAEGMADTIQKIAPIVGAVLDMLANFTPESLDKTIKGFMEGFVSALSNIGPAIAVLIDNLDEIAIGIVQAVIGLLAGIVANIPNFIGAILNTALELITQIVPRVIGTLRDVFRMAGQVMKIIWSDLASHVTGILTTLGNGLTSFFDSFLDFEEIQQTWAGAVARGIRDFFAVTVSDALSKFGTFMSGVFSSVVGFFKGIVNWFFGLFNKIIDGLNEIPGVNIPHIPALHSGGIVPGPAGQEVPIMALGGERIVPMDEAQEGGGWGRAINITINEARSPGETVDALVQALKMGVRTNRIHPMVLA